MIDQPAYVRASRTAWVMSAALRVVSSVAPLSADGRGGGDHRRAVGRAAQLDLGPPLLARADELGPGVGVLLARARRSRAAPARRRGSRPRGRAPRATSWSHGSVTGSTKANDGSASAKLSAHSAPRRRTCRSRMRCSLPICDQQRLLPLAGGAGERLGGDLGFDPRQLEALGEQLAAVGIEEEQAAGENQQRDQVDREDARGERGRGREGQPFEPPARGFPQPSEKL